MQRVHDGGRGDTGPSKSWLAPPNLAVLLTHCCQLILRKISKFDATRCQILWLKFTKFDFRWGSGPDPAGGAYNAPPNSLAVFKGLLLRGGKRKTGREKGKGERKGKGKGRGGRKVWLRTAPWIHGHG